jgi:preprotein translocase subunit YajC
MAQAAGGSGGGSLVSVVPIFLIFGVFYFLVIRPQSKKAKEHQHMLTELKKGDDVVTQGGVIGRITGIKDDEITLQVQEGVRLRILRSAVTGPRKAPEKAPDKAADSKNDVKAS